MNCASMTIREINIPKPASAGDPIRRPVLIAHDWHLFKVPSNALLVKHPLG
jgi:hypothetical protein